MRLATSIPRKLQKNFVLMQIMMAAEMMIMEYFGLENFEWTFIKVIEGLSEDVNYLKQVVEVVESRRALEMRRIRRRRRRRRRRWMNVTNHIGSIIHINQETQRTMLAFIGSHVIFHIPDGTVSKKIPKPHQPQDSIIFKTENRIKSKQFTWYWFEFDKPETLPSRQQEQQFHEMLIIHKTFKKKLIHHNLCGHLLDCPVELNSANHKISTHARTHTHKRISTTMSHHHNVVLGKQSS